MGDLGLSGVFSGIDSDAIITKLMTINARPLTKLQTQQSTEQARLKAMDDLKTQLASLQGILESLHDPDSLEGVALSSSDQDVVSVSAGAGVTAGSHQITVGQLARADRQVHVGVADKETALGVAASQFVYTLGIGEVAVTRTLQAGADTSLEELVGLINNDADNPGVTASILEHDDGSGLTYHLVLSSKQTGSEYPITVEAATTLAGFGGGDFERTQSAQNAWLKIDGYPSGEGQWIQRSSNNVSDVLPGLTLGLTSLGTVQVNAARNDAQIRETMNSMVTAYNALLSKVEAYTGYDEATKKSGILQGDAVANSMAMQVRSAMMGTVKGFLASHDAYTLAQQIGLSVDKEGMLSLNSSTFDKALSENYEDVLALIGANHSGASSSQHIQFVGASSDTQAGVYEVEALFNDTTGELLSARAKLQNASTWYDLTINAATGAITGPEDTPLELLQLRASWDNQAGTGGVRTQTAQLRLRQGFAGAAYDRLETMLDRTDGTVALKKKSIQSQIDSLSKSITRMQGRLVKQEERLRAKYARLEKTLADFERQKGQFEALLSSLAGAG